MNAKSMFEEYFDNANKMRGDLINEVINVEVILNRHIALFYCSDEKKVTELVDDIITGVPLKKKVKLFKDLTKEKAPHIYKSYKEILEELPTIIEMRDLLAHRVLSDSLEHIYSSNNAKIFFQDPNKPHIERKQVQQYVEKLMSFRTSLFFWER